MFRYSARALSQQNLDLSPNEVRSHLADIFRVQPSCISRQQYSHMIQQIMVFVLVKTLV